MRARRIWRMAATGLAAVGLLALAGPAAADVTVKTPDGRTVELRDDGTWRYLPPPETMLVDVWNSAACSLTGTATAALPKDAEQVTRIVTWYRWSDGQTRAPANLFDSEGASVASGMIERGDCDARAKNWCEGAFELNKPLKAGEYYLQVAPPRICQNSGSGGQGFVRVFAPAAEPAGPAIPDAAAEAPPPPPPPYVASSDAEPTGLQLTITPAAPTPADEIKVVWSGLPGANQDWVSVVSAGSADSAYKANYWTYTQSRKAGEFSVPKLPAGDYEARVYLDWPKGGYTVHARTPFTVAAAPPAPAPPPPAPPRDETPPPTPPSVTTGAPLAEWTGASLDAFERSEMTVIPGYNDKLLADKTVEECAKACLDEAAFECRSFDFGRGSERSGCYLSRVSKWDVPRSVKSGHPGYDHYSRKDAERSDAGGSRTVVAETLPTPVQPPPERLPTIVPEPTGEIASWTMSFGRFEASDAEIIGHAAGDGRTSYFLAPPSFQGDWRKFNRLRFDKKSWGGAYYPPTKHGADGDIVLESGEKRASIALSPHHTGDWRTYEIRLDDDGWRLSGGARSMEDVLANVTGLRIRAEYGEGTDHAGLRGVERFEGARARPAPKPAPSPTVEGFRLTERAAISGYNNRHLTKVTPAQCARACVAEKSFICKSFDYYRGKSACDLSAKSAREIGGLKRDYAPYDHYARAQIPAPPAPKPKPKPSPRVQGFRLTERAAIVGHNNRHLKNVTPAQCAQACAAEKSFICKSFDYYRGQSACDLSAKSARDAGGLTRNSSAPYDHYARTRIPAAPPPKPKPSPNVSGFKLTERAAISGFNNRHLTNVTPAECARACVTEKSFICKSFDYYRGKSTCDLSAKSAQEVGGLKRNYGPYDHYARARIPAPPKPKPKPSPRVKGFKLTERAAISGHNNRHLKNVTPDQCARACVAEKSFVCKSFDYYRNTAECDLSAKGEKDVGGLRRNYAAYDYYARLNVPPPRKTRTKWERIVTETFADGDASSNPQWVRLGGSARVDRKQGMRLTPRQGGLNIFAGKGAPRSGKTAVAVAMNRAVPNTFSLDIVYRPRSVEDSGRPAMRVGVVQGAARQSGFWLHIGGRDDKVTLYARTRNGWRRIRQVDAPSGSGDKNVRIQWSHRGGGHLIKVNGQESMRLTDRTFRQDFSSVVIAAEDLTGDLRRAYVYTKD